jgi:hypothetical protein
MINFERERMFVCVCVWVWVHTRCVTSASAYTSKTRIILYSFGVKKDLSHRHMLGPLIHIYRSSERIHLSMALQLKATDLVARQLKPTSFFVHSVTPQMCKWIILHWYYHWATEDLSSSVPIMEPESENNSIAVMEVLCHWNQHITYL